MSYKKERFAGCEFCRWGDGWKMPEESMANEKCRSCLGMKNFVPMGDAVNNPSHYQIMPGVEVIDVRRALLAKVDEMDNPPSGYVVSCWDRALEYLMRCWWKGGVEDMKKARTYLDKAIDESVETGNDTQPDGYIRCEHAPSPRCEFIHARETLWRTGKEIDDGHPTTAEPDDRPTAYRDWPCVRRP